MSIKTIKLTPTLLKRIILEEKKKISDTLATHASDARENAWAGGKNLVHSVDYIKKLGIKEAKLVDMLKKVRKAKANAKAKILSELG